MSSETWGIVDHDGEVIESFNDIESEEWEVVDNKCDENALSLTEKRVLPVDHQSIDNTKFSFLNQLNLPISLADGETLFDRLVLCSEYVSELTDMTGDAIDILTDAGAEILGSLFNFFG